VLFPTRRHVGCSEAESAFDVVQRPLGVPADTDGWAEQPVPTHPQQTFVDVSDGRTGLLVANRGLPEFEVLAEGPGTSREEADGTATIALTLLRCVGWLSRDDFPCRQGHAGPAVETPEAQCLGRATCHYSLVPHAGSWQDAYAHAHAFHSPLRAVGTDPHKGTLPAMGSLVRIEGQGLVLSAIKAAEASDGLIVRMYNITPQPSRARLSACRPIRRAELVDLAEQEQAALQPDASSAVTVEVKGKQIVTVKLGF
jgi:alpha-mannosidase